MRAELPSIRCSSPTPSTDVVERDEFPVLLGGDCSILLGSTLALRRRGRYGLLFIDGHADFYQPEANPNGEAASMDLAFATGHGPELLTNLEGLRPLVRDEDVVAFGFRDAQEQREYGSQPLPPDSARTRLEEVRRLGVKQAAQRAVDHLTAADRPTHGFFIHLDADVVSDALMPAVDYRMPDGLSWDELRTVLETALASGRAVGIEITIYNPSLDADGSSGRELARTLINALKTLAASDFEKFARFARDLFGGMRASAARSPWSSCFAIRYPR